jgi:hypothetical protein
MIFNSNDNSASANNANGTGTGNISNNLKQKAGDPLVPIVAMLFTMMAMAVIPAHLMRSVGGGFDNESVAMSAMTMTFYFWIRSLRTGEDKSYLWGVLTGLAYFYVSIVNCRMMDGCLTRAQFSYCICLLYSITLIVFVLIDGCSMGGLCVCLEHDWYPRCFVGSSWTLLDKDIPILHHILHYWNCSCRTNSRCWLDTIEEFGTAFGIRSFPRIPSAAVL